MERRRTRKELPRPVLCQMNPQEGQPSFELVRLASGAWAVRDEAFGEIMHPGCGPAVEAARLYVEQLRLAQRFAAQQGREVVLWDVGLGAGANALAMLQAASAWPVRVRLLSFDLSLEPLRFARRHAGRLAYLAGWQGVLDVFVEGRGWSGTIGEAKVQWEFVSGDFAVRMAEPDLALPAPDGIAYDPFSPQRNPELWTARLFRQVFRRLDPTRPCLLATYSRSNRVRVALLLAGFFVGRGCAVGMKEETTVASNRLEWLDRPLDVDWLARVRRSATAEPAWEPGEPPGPLRPATWEALRRHPQFAAGPEGASR